MKDKPLNIRASEKEIARWKKEAFKLNISLSEYIRNCCNNGLTKDLEQTLRELLANDK